MTNADDSETPDWMRENEQLREEMGLPEYEPPRFLDGAYTYEVTQTLEERYGCNIQFRGKDVRYSDPWDVLVDRVPALSIGRRRDRSGNTVYLMESDEFREAIENASGLDEG